MEKLDTYSKILLATQSINYMANTVNSVNEQIKMIPVKSQTIGDGITGRDNALFSVEKQLLKIMEELGDFMNANDISSDIDIRITKEAFSILHGNDNIEE